MKNKTPIIIAKIGAVKKNLNGTDIGGAWSVDNPLNILSIYHLMV